VVELLARAPAERELEQRLDVEVLAVPQHPGLGRRGVHIGEGCPGVVLNVVDQPASGLVSST
jgi:hypothetical protein